MRLIKEDLLNERVAEGVASDPRDFCVYPVCSICSRKVLTLTLIFYSVCALYQLYMNWTGPIGRKNQIQMSCPGQLGLPVSQMSGKRKNILFLHSNNLIPTKPIKSFVKISFSLAKN